MRTCNFFSLLLASFYYYWLFWPTQSWHCHHSDISLTLYYGLCRAQSRTKLFPALSRTKLFPALSRTKSMYHGLILKISALSISLLIKRMSGNFELISLLLQPGIETRIAQVKGESTIHLTNCAWWKWICYWDFINLDAPNRVIY